MRETATRTSVRFGVRRGSDESSSLFVSPLSPAFRLVLWRNPPFLFSPRGFLFASPPATELNARAAADSSHRFLFSSFLRTAFRAAVHRSRFRCRIRCSSFSGTTCFSFPPLFSALLLVFHAPLSLLFSVTDVLEKKQIFPILFSPVPVFLSRLDRANFEFRVCPPVTQFPPIAKGEGGDDGK